MGRMEASEAGEKRTVTVNGRPVAWRPGLTVGQLLRQLGQDGAGVAVERNRAVVPRAEHEGSLLRPGDVLEVVRLVGGG